MPLLNYSAASSKMALKSSEGVMKIWWESTTKSLDSLPVELQRNFKLMRELDSRAENVLQEIDRIADEILKSTTFSSEKRKESQAKIAKLFNKAKEFGDDKVQLAIQTYELVDKHIRRLDSDLARFESEIKNGTASSSSATDASQSEKKRGRKREKQEPTKKSKVEIEVKSPKGGSASPGRKKHKTEIQLVAEQVATVSAQDPSLDMPVDPNEPTYCICHQVSYGQMIACDNSECTIEWFHITCMGLQQIPKGRWYCPKCAPLRKK